MNVKVRSGLSAAARRIGIAALVWSIQLRVRLDHIWRLRSHSHRSRLELHRALKVRLSRRRDDMRSCLSGRFVSDGTRGAEAAFSTFQPGGYADAPCPRWCLWPLRLNLLADLTWRAHAAALARQLAVLRREPENLGAWLVAFRALRSCAAGELSPASYRTAQATLLREAGSSWRELEQLASRGGRSFAESFESVAAMTERMEAAQPHRELRLLAQGALTAEADPSALRLSGAL